MQAVQSAVRSVWQAIGCILNPGQVKQVVASLSTSSLEGSSAASLLSVEVDEREEESSPDDQMEDIEEGEDDEEDKVKDVTERFDKDVPAYADYDKFDEDVHTGVNPNNMLLVIRMESKEKHKKKWDDYQKDKKKLLERSGLL
jgi:hypothetical protein